MKCQILRQNDVFLLKLLNIWKSFKECYDIGMMLEKLLKEVIKGCKNTKPLRCIPTTRFHELLFYLRITI